MNFHYFLIFITEGSFQLHVVRLVWFLTVLTSEMWRALKLSGAVAGRFSSQPSIRGRALSTTFSRSTAAFFPRQLGDGMVKSQIAYGPMDHWSHRVSLYSEGRQTKAMWFALFIPTIPINPEFVSLNIWWNFELRIFVTTSLCQRTGTGYGHQAEYSGKWGFMKVIWPQKPPEPVGQGSRRFACSDLRGIQKVKTWKAYRVLGRGHSFFPSYPWANRVPVTSFLKTFFYLQPFVQIVNERRGRRPHHSAEVGVVKGCGVWWNLKDWGEPQSTGELTCRWVTT